MNICRREHFGRVIWLWYHLPTEEVLRVTVLILLEGLPQENRIG